MRPKTLFKQAILTFALFIALLAPVSAQDQPCCPSIDTGLKYCGRSLVWECMGRDDAFLIVLERPGQVFGEPVACVLWKPEGYYVLGGQMKPEGFYPDQLMGIVQDPSKAPALVLEYLRLPPIETIAALP